MPAQLRNLSMSPRLGDDYGFTLFYRREYQRAVRLAYLMTSSSAASEDLAQEAFVRVHPRFGELERPAAFLQVTLVNLCRSWHRSRKRQNAALLSYDEAPVSMEARELLDVLGRLPERHRTVLVLRYWMDWTDAQIAEAIHCPRSTVTSLAQRGLRRIRKQLGELADGS
jgi:RNA polymerase sigma factor (sigma-70 family)